MIDVNELRKGVTFTKDGELYKVISYDHHKPGRGKATIRTSLRNLRTGATTQENFTSGDRVENIRLDTRTVQFLYSDGEFLHFMDTKTYEQPTLPVETFGEDVGYLTPDMELKLSSYEGETLDYELPVTVEQTVAESEAAVAGDTATGATKQIATETGLKVQVPLFVQVGDVIRIDTRNGEYLTRV
jgi:elongation factor P